MPHYANGQPARTGDIVQTLTPNQRVLGILVRFSPDSNACNAQIMPLARQWDDGPWYPVVAGFCDCVTLKDCVPLKAAEVASGR